MMPAHPLAEAAVLKFARRTQTVCRPPCFGARVALPGACASRVDSDWLRCERHIISKYHHISPAFAARLHQRRFQSPLYLILANTDNSTAVAVDARFPSLRELHYTTPTTTGKGLTAPAQGCINLE